MADDGGLDTGVVRVEQKLDALEASVEVRFAEVQQRFDDVDAAILEQRRYTEFAYERLDAKMDAGFARIERKLDQFIDSQSRTNDLAERRLRRLERARPNKR